jgi:hypothetical protein
MATPTEIAQLLLKYFPERAIPGILGNIDVETDGSFDFQQQQKGGGNGYGLFQFDSQQEAYWDWLESTTLRDSAETQIKFVADSIYNDKYTAQGMFSGALDIGGKNRSELRESFTEDTDAEVATTFSNLYERPGIPHLDRRVAAAQKYRGLFSGE